jgi:ABC-type nitrate/sulfonate/bicarbonate transport system permease component
MKIGGEKARSRGRAANEAGPRRRYMLLSILSVLLGFVAWQVTARLTSKLFFAGPWETGASFVGLLRSGDLQPDLWVSGVEFSYGFGFSILIGVPIGLAMAVSRDVEAVVDPWASVLYSTPRLALGPLVVLWLGIGISSKVLLVFLGALFPILINTHVGAKNVDSQMKIVAHAFGATRWEQFRSILIPGALPHIISGLRLGAIQGILGVIVGEFFGSRRGVGNMIFAAAETFDTAKMFVGIAIFGGAGMIASFSLKTIEEWCAPWRQNASE